jgi:hypothetical protein
LGVFCETELSLQFASLKKRPEGAVFQHFEVQSEVWQQSCALFVGNFPRSSRGTAETETLFR